jgi:lysophospholipase L1-like esterase
MPRIPGDLSKGSLWSILGDSIAAGDSANKFYWGQCWFMLAALQTGGRVLPLTNGGVPGNTLAQMLARVDTDIIAYRPDRCAVGGGTNDVTTFSVASYRTTYSQILDRLRAAGIEPVIQTIPPRDDGYNATVAKMNAIARGLAEARGLWVFDLHRLLVDPSNGHYRAGYSSGDGIHPGIAAQKIIATYVASIMAQMAPMPGLMLGDDNADTGCNLITNGLFIGDTNADGVANSWSLNDVSGGTVTPTIETGDANVVGNQQVLTTTVAGQKYLSQGIASGWSPLDVLELSCKFTTSVEAGSSGPTIRLNCNGPSPLSVGLYFFRTDITRGILRTRVTVPAGTTSMSIYLFNTQASPPGTGVVKFSEVSLVNLTALGVA